MANKSKLVRQSRILGVIMLLIVGAVGYLFWDKIWPAPQATTGVVARKPSLTIPRALPEMVYDRRDFTALKLFGAVPVRPLPAPPSDPFAVLPENSNRGG